MKIFNCSNRLFLIPVVLIVIAAGITLLCNTCSSPSGAHQILEESGILGGLIVHLGCEDGRFTAALGAGDSYIVQGLTRNEEAVPGIRKYFLDHGLDGKVTAAAWKGEHLPYIDNLVNLIVVEDQQEVPEEEVMRVLAPGGAAFIKKNGGWMTLVKP